MLGFEDFKREYQEVPVEEYPNNVVEAVPEPMVSVKISTYQHADFIRDCLDGVLMQETNFPIEILIGEDESTDDTREICKEYAERYPNKIRLFLHRRENNIKIHGRPTGKFQSTYTRFKCRGKYIALCEGDDYWTDPKKLQKQVEFLEDNPEYVVSHHDAHVINAHGEMVARSKLPDQNKRDHSCVEMMKSPFILTLTLCFRNVLSECPKNYLKVMNGDSFVISILGRFGKGGYCENIKPARYRLHDESMWSSEKLIFQVKSKSHTFKMLKKYYKKMGYGSIPEHFESVHHSFRVDELRKLCADKAKNKNYLSSIKYFAKLVYATTNKDGISGLIDLAKRSIIYVVFSYN